jgi:hypothetical protein
MGLIKKITLLIIVNSVFFLTLTEDLVRSLALLYGLFIALFLNFQSYRSIEKSINKVYQGGGYALTSLLIGEVMKFVFLWAMLFIGYKGFGFPVKEMIFTFVFYYLFFIILNLIQKRH